MLGGRSSSSPGRSRRPPPPAAAPAPAAPAALAPEARQRHQRQHRQQRRQGLSRVRPWYSGSGSASDADAAFDGDVEDEDEGGGAASEAEATAAVAAKATEAEAEEEAAEVEVASEEKATTARVAWLGFSGAGRLHSGDRSEVGEGAAKSQAKGEEEPGPEEFEEHVHLGEFRVFCVLMAIVGLGVAGLAACSVVDLPQPASAWGAVLHGKAIGDAYFTGAPQYRQQLLPPPHQAVCMLLNLEDLRLAVAAPSLSSPWRHSNSPVGSSPELPPVNFTAPDGRVLLQASMRPLVPHQQGNSGWVIEIFAADSKISHGAITSDMRLFSTFSRPSAQIVTLRPRTFLLEPIASPGACAMPETCYNVEPSGAIVATSKTGTVVATATPVVYARECLEIAVWPGMDPVTVALAMIGIIAFKTPFQRTTRGRDAGGGAAGVGSSARALQQPGSGEPSEDGSAEIFAQRTRHYAIGTASSLPGSASSSSIPSEAATMPTVPPPRPVMLG